MRQFLKSLVFLLILQAGLAWAQDGTGYRLGIADVVQLNVLQQPDVDGSLVIRPDGTAVVRRVGEVALAGLTIKEAEDLIRQKLRLVNRDITDVSLTVTQYNALRIYVMGEVAGTGSYTFDTSPTLWDVIREAGGTTPNASLAAVRVISLVDGRPQTVFHDVSGMLDGSASPEPVYLKAGDTVIVPGLDQMASTPDAGVQVFGDVATPGTFALAEPTPLMTVLMLAGAPVFEGDLRKVLWVHDAGDGRFLSHEIDLRTFLEQGDPTGNPLVSAGDTVHVPRQPRGFWRTVYPLILGTVSTIAAVALTINRVGI